MSEIIIPGDPRLKPRKSYFDLSVYVGMNLDQVEVLKGKISEENISVFDSTVGIIEAIANYYEAPERGKPPQRYLAALERASQLTSNNIFPTPSTFVRSQIRMWLGREPLIQEGNEDISKFYNLRKRFLEDLSFREDILPDNSLQNEIQKRWDFAEEYSPILTRLKNATEDIPSMDDPEFILALKRELLTSSKVHFQLTDSEKAYLNTQWISGRNIPEIPAFKLFINFTMKMIRKYVELNKKPRVGDFLDLDHILYSTGVNYYVTQEKSKRGYRQILIESLQEIESKCQVLNFDEFCSQILGVNMKREDD